MERDLFERDRVGLRDQVLLEHYESEDAFIENLRKRFNENLIYVSSGGNFEVMRRISPKKALGNGKICFEQRLGQWESPNGP